MKITVIHGQDHKGCTYNLAHMLIKKAFDEPEVTEFFLPRDFSDFCTGCNSCFTEGEETCPHRGPLAPIVESMIDADVIVLASPTYCFAPTGQMKAFLDHLGYMWMSHRPHPSMFRKIGISVSACAGKGCDDTVKDLDEQMFMMGIMKRFTFGYVTAVDAWDNISDEALKKINDESDKIAKKIRGTDIKPDSKMKLTYTFMRLNQKSNTWNPLDKDHWQEQGWLDGKKPWE